MARGICRERRGLGTRSQRGVAGLGLRGKVRRRREGTGLEKGGAEKGGAGEGGGWRAERRGGSRAARGGLGGGMGQLSDG